MRSFFNRPVAAVAALAVSAAGLVGMATQAQAAQVTLPFDCAISILSGQTFTLYVDSNLPAEVEVGSTIDVELTGKVNVGESTIGAAYTFLSGRAMEGGANIAAKFGSQAVELKTSLPKTSIPASGSLDIPVSATGHVVASTVGTHALTIASFEAPLTLTKADNTTAAASVTCTAKSPNTPIASVKVVEKQAPTPEPTDEPTVDPTVEPTVDPTVDPTVEPTVDPTRTPKPSETATPTTNPKPTDTPAPGKPQTSPVKALLTVVVTILSALIKALLKKKR